MYPYPTGMTPSLMILMGEGWKWQLDDPLSSCTVSFCLDVASKPRPKADFSDWWVAAVVGTERSGTKNFNCVIDRCRYCMLSWPRKGKHVDHILFGTRFWETSLKSFEVHYANVSINASIPQWNYLLVLFLWGCEEKPSGSLQWIETGANTIGYSHLGGSPREIYKVVKNWRSSI